MATCKPWDKKWIEIGGDYYSLNQIENDILRKQFPDPRIHFALNCAARSCPPLASFAFTPEQLDHQLDQQTRAFVNQTIRASEGSKPLYLNKIFDWYGADFGDLHTFVNRYADKKISRDRPLIFKEYDWSLND